MDIKTLFNRRKCRDILEEMTNYHKMMGTLDKVIATPIGIYSYYGKDREATVHVQLRSDVEYAEFMYRVVLNEPTERLLIPNNEFVNMQLKIENVSIDKVYVQSRCGKKSGNGLYPGGDTIVGGSGTIKELHIDMACIRDITIYSSEIQVESIYIYSHGVAATLIISKIVNKFFSESSMGKKIYLESPLKVFNERGIKYISNNDTDSIYMHVVKIKRMEGSP